MSTARAMASDQKLVDLPKRKPSVSDLFHSDLHSSARLVYAVMCFYGVNTSRCWTAIPILARHTGLSESGVRNALRQLEEAGFVCCVHASRGGRRKASDGTLKGLGSEYTLNPTGRFRKEPSSEYRVRTPQSVEGSFEQPSSECADTLHSVRENPVVIGAIRRIEEKNKKTTTPSPNPESEQNQGREADGEDTCTQENINYEEHGIFDVWQQQVSCLLTGRSYWPANAPPMVKIAGDLRREIKTALQRQGFTVAHMNHSFDFGELVGWKNWRLGLLRAAREFRDRYGHEQFPLCFTCNDTKRVEIADGHQSCPRCQKGDSAGLQRRPAGQRKTEQIRLDRHFDCTLCDGSGSYRNQPCLVCCRQEHFQHEAKVCQQGMPQGGAQ
jgi:hypothetical protein